MSNPRLIVRDLTVSYGRIPAIHHLNLDLACGHCIGLLGPNGAGKTTFIKALAGLVRAETGSVTIDAHGDSRRAGRIAYLPQRGMVEMGRFPALGAFGRFERRDRNAVEEALAVARLLPFADRQINALSGGQQQRAFLARAYAQRAEFYLLDEPFGGLDAQAQADLREILRAMTAAGKLILASHHDLKTVPDLFDQVILLNGELVAFGPVAEAFTPANIERTYATQVFANPA